MKISNKIVKIPRGGGQFWQKNKMNKKRMKKKSPLPIRKQKTFSILILILISTIHNKY